MDSFSHFSHSRFGTGTLTDILRRPYSPLQIEQLTLSLARWSAQQVETGNNTSIRQHIDSLIQAWNGIDPAFPIVRALRTLIEQHIVAWDGNQRWTHYFLTHDCGKALATDPRFGPLLRASARRASLSDVFDRVAGIVSHRPMFTPSRN